jgi:uroporphyrinogen-III synthase
MSSEAGMESRSDHAGQSPSAARSTALAGKTIVVTRSPEQSQEFVALLEGRGAQVLLLPMIRFEDPEDTLLLDASLRALDRIDWILFTSANAVRFAVRRATALKVSLVSSQPRLKIAAVGPATAKAAENEGLAVNYVAKNHNGAALVAELQSQLRGKRVLLPRTNIATDDLPRALREKAAQVIEVVAYRTVSPVALAAQPIAGGRIMGTEPPPSPEAIALEKVRNNDIDLITFASPSAFHNFAELLTSDELRRLSQSNRFAAIGPTTAQAIRDAGCTVAVEAQQSNVQRTNIEGTSAEGSSAEGFVAAIAKKFAEAHKKEVQSQ